MTTKKYHVLMVNSDCTATILYTTPQLNECHLFIAEYMNEKLQLDGKFQKAYYETENIISVYNYHYLFPKSLKCKISVIDYIEDK